MATLEVGTCTAGVQTCGSDNIWGPCDGELGPTPEVCADDDDNDCDGETNEADAVDCTKYVAEVDEDNDEASPGRCLCGPDVEGGYVIEVPADSLFDCCDSDNQAHPTQTVFFPQPNSCGVWDYDCDLLALKEFSDCAECALNAPGWDCLEGSVPECGGMATWISDFSPECEPVPETRTLSCR